MSPYHEILINTGMGNPTTPSIVALGKQAIPNGQVGRRTAFVASIKGQEFLIFTHAFFLPSHTLDPSSSSTLVQVFSA